MFKREMERVHSLKSAKYILQLSCIYTLSSSVIEWFFTIQPEVWLGVYISIP